MSRLTTTLPVAAALAASLALGGCAGAAPEPVSLVDTKSPVQLLRNGVASRITAGALFSVDNSQDLSQECGAGDPERRWFSGVELSVTDFWVELMPDIMRSLVDSFVEDGWTPVTEGDQVTLVSETSVANIHIAPSSGDEPRIVVEVTGPCVLTDGADSDEVLSLEADF